MKYSQSILVKGGRRILLRNGEASDGGAVLELSVVADNARAMAPYQRAGFVEYGRNPKGFYSRTAGFQELVSNAAVAVEM